MNKVLYEIWRGEGSLTLVSADNRIDQPSLVAGKLYVAGLEIEFTDEDDLTNKLNEFRDKYLSDNWDSESEKWKTL